MPGKQARVDTQDTYRHPLSDFGIRSRKNQYSNIAYVALHLTPYCNLQCVYCFESAPLLPPEKMKRQFMSLSTIEQTLEKILSHTRREEVTLLFFGGEPLLLGLGLLKKASRIADKVAEKYQKKLKKTVSTNGTLLTEKYARMLREESIGVCISIDGPPEISDKTRKNSRLTVRGLEALLSVGSEPNSICVLNPFNIDHLEEIFEFYRKYRIKYVRMTPMSFAGNAVSGVEFDNFDDPINAVLHVLEYMLRTEGEDFVDGTLLRRINQYYDASRGIGKTPKNYDCYTRTCWAGDGFLAVDAQGNLYPCSRCVHEKYKLGNITDPVTSISDQHPVLRDLHSKGMEYYDCEMCPSKPICFAGCSVHNKQSEQNFKMDCLLTKRIHNYFEDNRLPIIHLAEKLRRKFPGNNCLTEVDDSNVMVLLNQLRISQLMPVWALGGLIVVVKDSHMFLIDSDDNRAFEIDDNTFDFLKSMESASKQENTHDLTIV